MKTKEFIEKIEELGFEVVDGIGAIHMSTNRIDSVAHVDKEKEFSMYTCTAVFRDLREEQRKQLFELCVEYAKTPIEDREEEKKFYLKHKWLTAKPIYKNYLNHWLGTDEYCIGYKNETAEIQTQFTEKEIEYIKKYNNTDLKDFKQVEVKE